MKKGERWQNSWGWVALIVTLGNPNCTVRWRTGPLKGKEGRIPRDTLVRTAPPLKRKNKARRKRR